VWATPSPTRIGRSARSTNDMTSTYGSGGLLGGRTSVYGVSGDPNPGEHFVAVPENDAPDKAVSIVKDTLCQHI
jgi:hypothetical protein